MNVASYVNEFSPVFLGGPKTYARHRDPWDLSDIANHLIKFLQSPEDMRRLGLTGRVQVKTRPTWKKLAAKTAEFSQKLKKTINT